MIYTDPILEEKYKTQKRLSESARDIDEYFNQVDLRLRKYCQEHDLKLNYQPFVQPHEDLKTKVRFA